jgi:hypothetical protein
VQQRIIALPRSERSKWLIDRLKQRTKSQEDRMNGTEREKSPVLTSQDAASPAVTKRTCEVAGCEGKLAYNNTTGFCHEHRARAHKKTNAVVRKTNRAAHHSARENRGDSGAQHAAVAHVSKPDGHALAIAERVELVLRTIPLAEKSRMVAAWLAGN